MATQVRETDGARVSTLELFFDLVFVFTLTQLTEVLAKDFDWGGFAQVAVMLGALWWMYGGYVWMTNAVATDKAGRRLLLLGGMGAYLILALAVPDAFDDTGLAFGIAYAGVVLVHSAMFSRIAPGKLFTFSQVNLAFAATVVLGGALGGTAQYVLWALGGVATWISPKLLNSDASIEIAPAHFVERHGLVVIVALGESIVALGIGAQGLELDAALILVALLGLTISACLWWAYFGGDDELAERAMSAAAPRRRSRMAIDGFGYAHYLMLIGIVALAAALKKATGYGFDPFGLAAAVALAGGLALFVVGDVLFRRSLGIGRVDLRLVAGALALATIPLGTEVAAIAQMAAIVLIAVVLFAAEDRLGSATG